MKPNGNKAAIPYFRSSEVEYMLSLQSGKMSIYGDEVFMSSFRSYE